MCPHAGILGLISLIHRLRDLLGTGILLALEGPSLLPKPRALTYMPTCGELFQEHPENYHLNNDHCSLIHL